MNLWNHQFPKNEPKIWRITALRVFIVHRAEILQIYRLILWKIDDFINPFWLNLTFKGLYSDQFGSASCVRCPLYHTTRGLGSKKASQCYYHRSATRSRMVDRQKKPARKKGSVEASFMRYYNRWSSRNQQQKRT